MTDVKVTYSPIVNFAMQQNHIPFVQKIEVCNQFDASNLKNYENIDIRLVSDPGFIKACQAHISSLAAGEEYVIDRIETTFSTDVLSSLTESIEGSFDVIVSCGEEELFRRSYPVKLLAFDQWQGEDNFPELTSAFVTPDHPTIAPILKRASEIICKWTGSAGLEGYQSDSPERIKFQMGAIYEALSEQGIEYCSAPASFEDAGQRVRLADKIFNGRIATCLDIALLYAGCLEAAGIHPLLVINRTHAFAGGWLIDETFADSVNDDASLLTKRTADGINEIILVETTGMTEGCRMTFDQAVDKGEHHLHDDIKEFEIFIDVAKGRAEHIRPLSVLEDGAITREWKEGKEGIHSRPASLAEVQAQIDTYEKTVVDKQIIWERKLLDLGLRNHLLNASFRGASIQILSVNPAKVEDILASGAALTLSGIPAGMDVSVHNHIRALAPSDSIYEAVRADLDSRRLRLFLPEEHLQRRLTVLYRTSRTTMEENGANTLYLALGVLKWFETRNTTKPRYAPLLLIPVEVARKSASSGYVLRSRDEDTVFNITLLEMLRQTYHLEIPGLNPLPKDEKGVNVSEIFNIVRRCIMEQTGWDVEETALLGNFSFNKFLMWNDIHNNAGTLRKHPIVNSLMTGVVDAGVNEIIETEEDLDATIAPGEILLPLSADSSQLKAISASMSGKSFILHGPPGTGKSQSITNIIANALYRGKKVLFVAEKMAALEVVQKRLEEIGLAPFCLELHSNKAKKTAVMEQLKRTIAVTKQASSEHFASEASRINSLRQEINSYLLTLHKKYPLGVSLYDCLSRYCSFSGDCPPYIPEREWMLALREEDIAGIEDALSQYITACSICGSPSGHPLTGITAKKYPSEDVASLIEALDAERMVEKLNQSLKILFSEDENTLDRKQTEAFKRIVEGLGSSRFITSELMLLSEDELEDLDATAQDGHKRDAIAAEICKKYSRRILDIAPDRFRREYEAAMAKSAVGKHFALRKLCKRLSVYTNDGLRPAKESISTDIDLLMVYSDCSGVLAKKATVLKNIFGKLYTDSESDWDNISEGIRAVKTINEGLITICGRDWAVVHTSKGRIAKFIECGISTYMQYEGHVLSDFSKAYDTFLEGFAHLQSLLEADFPDESLSGWAGITLERLKLWNGHIGELRDWIIYNKEKSNVTKLGLQGLIDAVESSNIPASDSLNALRKGIYKTYADYIISQEASLSDFHGMMFEEKIRRFRSLCDRFEKLTRKELYAKVASSLPALQKEAMQSSSVGILQRNIRNNCRGTSLRVLFDKIQDILPRICPCMLMSPLSVSQYIDADGFKFDLVIFDEASQMPTCEAVGAISRGKAIIVAGDPNQMPPTNFFLTSTFNEDNVELEDLESILDDCLAMSLPSKYLKWHYRSKHESLIAFSNAKYYDNKLLTFPSPDDMKTQLRYQYIPDGIYERGGARQNRAEAQAVIREIKSRLTDPSRKEQSIGVITFNSNQQTLIEDLLGDLFRSHPEIEKAATECNEPVFVKNLENVQGDERDVILFSVGYGPDARGNITLNFGPLNREGGWRRLNVAVSRARYEMKVFSTLRSDQINLTRSSAGGVAGLKSFLEYAERGREALRYNAVSSHNTDDNVVLAIARELRRAGFTVNTNIGCSGYRIDIGIVDSNNPNRYLLGVLCDGYNSKATRTARDREIVQTRVLKALGWNICRIWTMDWWNSPDKALEKINNAINHPETIDEQPIPDIEPLLSEEPDAVRVQDKPHIETATSYEAEDSFVDNADIDDFNEGHIDHEISVKVQAVIDKEAPISIDLLNRRICQAFGFQQVGQKMRRHLAYLYDDKLRLKSTTDGERKFYWKDSQEPENPGTYRSGNNRDAMDIAPQEIGVAVLSILQEQGALGKEDLFKETAKRFGYARLGERVSNSITAGINHLMETGRIIRNGDDKFVEAPTCNSVPTTSSPFHPEET